MPQEQDSVAERSAVEPGALRGSNQSGMRLHNERLVLSLVRREGPMAKSDIARATGLSAQTVSVIMRALESDGLFRRGQPVRGRIGQPSVPMALSADGALFFGLKIGRRSSDLVLIDFLGHVRGFRRRVYAYPTPDAIVRFVSESVPSLRADLPPELRDRIMGFGVGMPFQLWSWVSYIGAPQAEMDAWRVRDIQAEIADLIGMPVYVQNDATAACGAELVFGTGERPSDFLYFYIAYFIGGGLVLNGRLFTGRTGNAAGVGPMPVPGPDGKMQRLLTVASMSTLADEMTRAGLSSDQLWESPDWTCPDRGVLDRWMTETATGIANASQTAAALLELHTVMIDGWVPADIRAEITRRTHLELHRLDLSGIDPPVIREGTVGPQARALGAAAIPLSQRYLVDQPSA